MRVGGEQWVVGKSLVGSGVLDDESLVADNRIGTECVFPRCLGGVEAHTGFEPLTVLVNEAHERVRRRTKDGGDQGDVVESSTREVVVCEFKFREGGK